MYIEYADERFRSHLALITVLCHRMHTNQRLHFVIYANHEEAFWYNQYSWKAAKNVRKVFVIPRSIYIRSHFLVLKKNIYIFFQVNIYSVIKKHQLNGMNLILTCIYQINCLSSVESDMNQNRRKHYPY